MIFGGAARRRYGRLMTRFAIDPPTLLELADGRHRVNPIHRLVAPNSIRLQALELLLQRVRDRELSERAALSLHDGITELKIRLLGDRVSRRTAWQIAREHDWDTLREAEYLAVAKLQADALTALDPEMVARAEGIVRLAPFPELLVD